MGSPASRGGRALAFTIMNNSLGVPIIRIVIYWSLNWGPPILGNYFLGSSRPRVFIGCFVTIVSGQLCPPTTVTRNITDYKYSQQVESNYPDLQVFPFPITALYRTITIVYHFNIIVMLGDCSRVVRHPTEDHPELVNRKPQALNPKL